MATTTHPAQRPSTPDPPTNTGQRLRTGPIRRIIGASLATGLIAAGVLTLVVFAGAREHAITGSALLGFAAGWTMLAVLSTRMTNQPQRWAFVPAAAMALTGTGLLILTPDDDALTAAGWVWPPVLLALAIWIGVRIHRSLAAGSGRWALYPIAAVLAAAAVGGSVETITLTHDQHLYAMPGRSYDVGDYRLHLNCTGSGSPTVVLQSGLGEFSSSWARIAPTVAGTTRVCAYDRAGQGWSDDAPQIQDGLRAAADLHTLLDRAGENGPYVLVGHSIGGSYAMTYAARYPEQVAGMVLLDASNPYQARATGQADLRAFAPLAVLPSIARLGIGQLFPSSSNLPQPDAGRVQAFENSPRGWRNAAEEWGAMDTLFSQGQALSTLGGTPLVVITASESMQQDGGWSAVQGRMAALSTSSSHRVAQSSHEGLLGEERGASMSTRAILDVLHSVRTGTAPAPN